ncbi:MAG: DUF4249 domain-containing protein [Bacteroidales bacterium]|jgi:hypothetical protein|nr:DUF4249 domain-containing protein [Bacteroidales bacterium]
MKSHHIISFLLLCVFLVFQACKPEVERNSFSPEIVVEGVIENDGYASVILSQLVPVGVKIDSADMTSIPIRGAKVTVSNGEEKEVLTGMRNNDYFLKYEYRTLHLKGEVGKTYTLTVEYSGRKLTAVTTIPSVPELADLQIVDIADSDTLFSLMAKINDNGDEKNYYMFHLKKEELASNTFRPCFLGTVNDEVLQQDTEIPICTPLSVQGEYSVYFSKKEKYRLKLSQIGETEYAFWQSCFNQILGMNPIYPNMQNLGSNIKGGLGIWYGCGSREYIIN